MQLSITSRHLSVSRDKSYQRSRKMLSEIYYGEYVEYAHRRPKPNATESRSIIFGSRFPSFRYRSGWYSMGLLKTLGSCNMDLNKRQSRHKIRPIIRSYWPCITEHDRPFRNIVTTVLIIVSSHVGKSFIFRQDGTDDDDYKDEQRGATK